MWVSELHCSIGFSLSFVFGALIGFIMPDQSNMARDPPNSDGMAFALQL